jgi:hypothetical protein
MTGSKEVLEDGLLVEVAGVIGADGDFHDGAKLAQSADAHKW